MCSYDLYDQLESVSSEQSSMSDNAQDMFANSDEEVNHFNNILPIEDLERILWHETFEIWSSLVENMVNNLTKKLISDTESYEFEWLVCPNELSSVKSLNIPKSA